MDRRIVLAIAVILVVAASSAYFMLHEGSPRQLETVHITMTTFTWGFNVTTIPNFQDGTIYRDNPTITVHLGQVVVITIRSLDITHGFAIDEFGAQAVIPPGPAVTVSFVANRVGNFTYYCNTFCGVGHPYMHGILQVLP